MRVSSAGLGIEIFWEAEEQYVAKKIENRFFNCRVAALGRGDCTLDHLSIFFAHRPAGREISSINGKAGDGLAYGSRKRFQREVAIPAVLLREPVEHVAENIDIVRQRQLHYLQLFGINQ